MSGLLGILKIGAIQAMHESVFLFLFASKEVQLVSD